MGKELFDIKKYKSYLFANGLNASYNVSSSYLTGSINLNFTNSISTNNVTIDSISYLDQQGINESCPPDWYIYCGVSNDSGRFHPDIGLAFGTQMSYYYNHIINNGHGQSTALSCNSITCMNFFAIFDSRDLPNVCENASGPCLVSPPGIANSTLLIDSDALKAMQLMEPKYGHYPK